MKTIKRTLLLCVAGCLLVPAIASAQLSVPEMINVQALVLDSEGEPVSGSYDDARVSLWTLEDAGSEVWAGIVDIQIDDGLVSFTLQVTSTNIFAANEELWLEVALSDDLVVDRRRLMSVPYAYFADAAGQADFADAAGSVAAADIDGPVGHGQLQSCTSGTDALLAWNGSSWVCSAAITIGSGGRVGIGESDPGARLEVATASETAVYASANHSLGLNDGIYSTAPGSLNSADGYGCALYKAYFPGGGGIAYAVHQGANDDTAATRTFEVWSDGTVSATSVTATGVCCSSDERYKSSVETLENPLSKIKQLRGVSFDWRTREFGQKHFPDGRQIGIVAQELEQQYPELVRTDSAGYKAVDYGKLTAVLLEAVKEQQRQIDELRARIDRNSD